MFRIQLLALVMLLSGCVSHIPIAQQIPSVDYVSKETIVVAVVDQRERVKNGKPRTFIGVAHGAFGIPADWNVNPVLAVEEGDKKRDLAQFLQYRIVQGLAEKGWNAIEAASQTTAPTDEETNKILSDAGAQSLLLLKLNEWYFSINLNWVGSFNFDTDTEVVVYRSAVGKTLEKRFAGRDVIEQEASQSPQNHILMAYRNQLAEILNDPEVKRALTGE